LQTLSNNARAEVRQQLDIKIVVGMRVPCLLKRHELENKLQHVASRFTTLRQKQSVPLASFSDVAFIGLALHLLLRGREINRKESAV